jgi:hypothetical protein
MGSPNLFETLDSKGFPQDSATQGGVGRTLLSAAFDFDFKQVGTDPNKNNFKIGR